MICSPQFALIRQKLLHRDSMAPPEVEDDSIFLMEI